MAIVQEIAALLDSDATASSELELWWFKIHPLVLCVILSALTYFLARGLKWLDGRDVYFAQEILRAKEEGRSANTGLPFLRRIGRWFCHTAEHFSGALAAVLFVFWMLELPHIRGVIDDAAATRLRTFSLELDDKYAQQNEEMIAGVRNTVAFDRLGANSEFWHSFSTEQRGRIRGALLQAETDRVMDQQELRAYDAYLMTTMGQRRTGLTLYRTIEVEGAGAEKCYLISDKFFVTYRLGKNHGPLPFPVGARSKILDWLNPDKLYNVEYFEVNGEPLDIGGAERVTVDDEVVTSYAGAIQCNGREVLDVAWRAIYRVPCDDYLSMRMAFPTSGVTIQVNYPPDAVLPKLFLFGLNVGREPLQKPKESGKGWLRWESDAWLMPQHGWMMELFPVRPSSGVEAAKGAVGSAEKLPN